MSDFQKEKDQKFNNVLNSLIKLSKLSAIVSSAYQYKSTENLIIDKTSKEENVIIFGIENINTKVLTNPLKYENIINRKDELLLEYKDVLDTVGTNYDNQLTLAYVRQYEEDLEQLEKLVDIYMLRKKENEAKRKVDNSDDEIAEEIYDIEDELGKSEAKSRRGKTSINAKIKEKNKVLMEAMESEEKEIHTKIKRPTFLLGAKKFFFGRFNPKKLILQCLPMTFLQFLHYFCRYIHTAHLSDHD